METPIEYEELQIQMISALDAEYKVVAGEGDLDIQKINQKWEEILEQYFWLNK